MKKTFFLLFAVLSLSLFSCKKTGTLTVTVNKQSAGQPSEIAANAIVMATGGGSSRLYEMETSAQGIVVFDNVKIGEYTVSSQVWDGTGYLEDEEVVSVAAGKNTNVNLLLQ